MDWLTSFDLAVDGYHLGAPGGVQGEDVGEIVTGADDRADDRLAVDDGVEDRQGQLTRAGLGDRNILHLQGGVEIGDNCCSHGVFHSGEEERTFSRAAPGKMQAGERVTK